MSGYNCYLDEPARDPRPRRPVPSNAASRPLRVVVCGSRNWTDRETIRAWLARLPLGSEVAHGGAPGADTIAGEEAGARGLSVHVFQADWSKHGNAAGPIRNRWMLDTFKPALVLAFTDSLLSATKPGRLSGTGDCVAAANERRIRATVIPSGSLP